MRRKKFVSLNKYSQIHSLNLFKAFMRSLIIGIFLAILFVPAVKAQQDAQFSMYMFNRYVLNPAYAGALRATNITGLGRAQWVGIEGAPRTATTSINGYVKQLHGGVGAYIVGDQLGAFRTMGLKGSYAYHLNFSNRTHLNIGVGGGIYQKQLSGDWRYNQDNGIDPTLPLTATSALVPDLDAGIYFHINRKNASLGGSYPQDAFYFGASVAHILEPSLDGLTAGGTNQSTLDRGINAMIGGSIDLSTRVTLSPSANFRMAGPLTQFDLNANLYVSPMVFGVSHRWNDSFTGIVGFNASSYLFVAYAYDYTTSGLGSFTTGSHELIVSYTFPSKFKIGPPERGTRTKYLNNI